MKQTVTRFVLKREGLFLNTKEYVWGALHDASLFANRPFYIKDDSVKVRQVSVTYEELPYVVSVETRTT